MNIGNNGFSGNKIDAHFALSDQKPVIWSTIINATLEEAFFRQEKPSWIKQQGVLIY